MAPPSTVDKIQEQLDAVNSMLGRRDVLRGLSPSQLPSAAVSSGTPSPPTEDGTGAGAADEAAVHLDAGTESRLTYTRPPFDASNPTRSLTAYLDISTNPTNPTNPLEPTSASWRSHTDLIFPMASEAGFHSSAPAFRAFKHGHNDLVLSVDYNLYGKRLVTGSSDHCVKVWEMNDDGTWAALDTWKAHDAEVVDVKWNGPFTGNHIGSIGEDGKFKLWEEDVIEVPGSGKRFKLVYEQKSGTKSPYMSMDFKNVNTETYLALITRDGLLTVSEPVDHDNVSGEWKETWTTQVCAPPPPPEEASFRVHFHHDKLPAFELVLAGLDRKALSLAVGAMDSVKIYRTDRERRFYLAAELKGHGSLVRDIAWANGASRGWDQLATAAKDGRIRVFDVVAPATAYATRTGLVDHSATPAEVPSPPSGASASRPTVPNTLVSTGDDGSVRFWQRATSGRWLETAEVAASG
ncbi:hypothetical protein B0A49_00341 [Cryomyces minteri]|uniref:WD40 repeat-like protein n=1 Tax=Cryomyces minteri TaxID=331657 RepID=A0A4V5NJI0_9PEZI|nr:hypothetical protein B0A49_00341 [Cryomyces minteri]